MAALTVVGATVVRDADAPARREAVRIAAGRIVRLGGAVRGGRLDATGFHLVPGLVDAHVHLVLEGENPFATLRKPVPALRRIARRNALALARSGVTAARDLGGKGFAEIAGTRGIPKGARLAFAGHILAPPRAHAAPLVTAVSTPHGARAAVDAQVRGGATWIKVSTSGGILTPRQSPHDPEMGTSVATAVVRAARAEGVPVAAHAHGARGIAAALQAGVRSVEHGSFLTDAQARQMAVAETFLVPTLVAAERLCGRVPAGLAPPGSRGRAAEVLESAVAAVRLAVRRRVPLALGTDGGTPNNPHGGLWREMRLLAEAGLPPDFVFRAATEGGARLLGLRAGRIRETFHADLVLLESDPREDPEAYRTVRGVIRGGEVLRGF